MKLEMPKLTHEQALEMVKKIPFLDKTPEEIVADWEKFAQEIPIGSTVTRDRFPDTKGVTKPGRYYNAPLENYINIQIGGILESTWLVSDVKKVEGSE